MALKKNVRIEIGCLKEAEEYKKFIYVIQAFCYNLIYHDFDTKKDENISEQEISNDIKTRFLVDALILPDASFREKYVKDQI